VTVLAWGAASGIIAKSGRADAVRA
jgi:hypothetical protein